MDIKPVRRTNHNGILIEVEALLDLDIGFICSISETDYDYSIIKETYANSTIPQLQDKKLEDADFLYNAFTDTFTKEIVDNLFEDYKKDHAEDLIIKSPEVQSIKRIIEIFSKSSKEIASPVVLSRNLDFLPYLKNRYPTLTILGFSGKNKFDFTPYARFIIEDINRISDYGKMDFRHITVLSYMKNFTEVDGEKILHPAPVLLYGSTNQFDIIEPNTRRY